MKQKKNVTVYNYIITKKYKFWNMNSTSFPSVQKFEFNVCTTCKLNITLHIPCLFAVTAFTCISVAFKIYDMDKDGYISNGELFTVLKMMVGNNLKDAQLQQIVDKTIIFADTDGDGKISFEEFCGVSVFMLSCIS